MDFMGTTISQFSLESLITLISYESLTLPNKLCMQRLAFAGLDYLSINWEKLLRKLLPNIRPTFANSFQAMELVISCICRLWSSIDVFI